MASIADSLRFHAHGTVKAGNGEREISGHLVISDGLRFHNQGNYLPIPPGASLGSQQYVFYVVDFSLNVGRDRFSGQDGRIYFEWLADGTMGDMQWWLIGSGSWSRWHGHLVSFHYADGRRYEHSPRVYAVDLAPLIRFTGLLTVEPKTTRLALKDPNLWLTEC